MYKKTFLNIRELALLRHTGNTDSMTERQRYELLKEIKAPNGTRFEIRRYLPCAMADVTVSGDSGSAANLGFRPLVTYISQNQIAMTAPVLQEQVTNGSWTVSFVMPADMSADDLPLPADTKVRIRQVSEQIAAALSFRGYTSNEVISKREKELRAALTETKIAMTGAMRVARFDPPWKPGFARHNEVIIPVDY